MPPFKKGNIPWNKGKRKKKIKNYCVDCGKEIVKSHAKRCRNCAQSDIHRNKNHVVFLDISDKIQEQICYLYEIEEVPIRELSKIFSFSNSIVKKILITKFQAKYKLIAKQHDTENRRRIARKCGKSRKGKKLSQIAKDHIREGRLKYMEENPQKNFTSSWEDTFYEILKIQNPDLEIKRQYRISGVNHIFDIAIPELKLLIEIDGDYWHDNPDGRKRDAQIDAFAQEAEWIIIRINDAILRFLGLIK